MRVAVLGVPLILVLGHDACGAVDATIKSLKDNTHAARPSAVAGDGACARGEGGRRSKAGDMLDNAIRQNVIDNVAKLKSAAPILTAAVEQNKLKIVGGIYRLKDGKVDMVA